MGTQALGARILNNPALLYGGAFVLAWMILFAPAYYYFGQTAWTAEENGHMPFIIAICAGTAWARLADGGFERASQQGFIGGLGILCLGLAMYGAGRLGEIDLILSASQTVVGIGAVMALFGPAGVRRLWFPILLSVYLIVIPGWALEEFTAPLKRFVAMGVSDVLFAFGLPVAHSGAVISAGSYELLVADACSGLNSIFALTVVGAIYLYVIKRPSMLANAIMVAMLVPLAIAANFFRVGILVLVTYYLGYDAGQSFLHELAGLVMFAAALGMIFLIDAALVLALRGRS